MILAILTTGSEKQKNWAESLRKDLIEKYESEKKDLTEIGCKLFERFIEKCVDATCYIKAKDFSGSVDDFLAYATTKSMKAYFQDLL